METKSGDITIAPQVLEAIARLTTLAVPGVARLTTPPGVQRFLRHDGIKIDVIGNSVYAKVYVVTEPGAQMLKVGRQIQAEVARAVHDIVGMEVRSVDVMIEDVALRAGKA